LTAVSAGDSARDAGGTAAEALETGASEADAGEEAALAGTRAAEAGATGNPAAAEAAEAADAGRISSARKYRSVPGDAPLVKGDRKLALVNTVDCSNRPTSLDEEPVSP
jgi:hypothetical protein